MEVEVATEKANFILPISSLVSGTKRSLETANLRVLDISEKLTKYVGVEYKEYDFLQVPILIKFNYNWTPLQLLK